MRLPLAVLVMGWIAGFALVACVRLPQEIEQFPVDLTADRTEGNAPLELTFTAVPQAEVAADSTYAWHFDDGVEVNAGPTVTHSFLKPGRYVVWVRVSSGPGWWGREERVVRIWGSLTSYQDGGVATRIDCSQDHGYLVEDSGGLRVLDLDPATLWGSQAPRLLRTIGDDVPFAQSDGTHLRVLEGQTLAYYWVERGVPDSTPQTRNDIGFTARAVLDGVRFLYALGDGEGGQGVVKVIDSYDWSTVRTLSCAGKANDLFANDRYLYVAHDGGLDVYDIATAPAGPDNPVEWKKEVTSTPVRSVLVVDSFVYAAAGSGGVRIYEQLFQPENGTLFPLRGVLATPGSAERVRGSGRYLLLADGSSGMHVVDVADPSAPRIVRSLDTPGYASDFCRTELPLGSNFSGGLLSVADGSAGLQVLFLEPEGP